METTGSSSDAIDPTLQTADGVVEAVVRFEAAEPAAIAQSDDPVASLHSQAERQQKPLLEYAESTDGVSVRETLWVTNAVVVEIDTRQIPLERIASIDGVERIHENFELELTSATASAGAVDDGSLGPSVSNATTTSTAQATYGLDQINVPDVWSNYETRGAGTTVAVLDTGIDVANHSDLELAQDGWRDFADGRSTPYDKLGHGTHVSGIITGNQLDDGSHYGVAPEADLIHGKVFDDSGSASFLDVADGLQWAIDHQADVDVVSLSLGAKGYHDFLIESINNVQSAGISVTVAAGNNGAGTSSSPGNYYGNLNIGATTASETIADFSSGEEITTSSAWDDPPSSWPKEYIVPAVSAPGTRVESSSTGGGYHTDSGTSMATPHVAGTIALMQSASSDQIGPDQISSALIETAWKPDGEPTERDTRYGDGIIDAYAATQMVTKSSDISLISAEINQSSISVNDSVTTTATVENTGGAAGDFTVAYSIDGVTRQSRTITVGAGETEQLTFKSTFSEAGTYRLHVNDQLAGEVEVNEPAQFDVSDLRPETTTVEQGERFNVSAAVSNTGTVTATKSITLTVSDERRLKQEIKLAGGESTTVTFGDVNTSSLDPGNYSYTVSSEDSAVSGTLTVDGPAQFDVSDLRPETTTVEQGESFNVSAAVSNTGTVTATKSVTLTVSDELRFEQEIGLAGGESTTVTFGDVNTSSLDPGNYSYTVSSEDSAVSGTLTVDGPAQFDVSDLRPETTTVEQGDSFNVSATVSNAGTVTATKSVRFRVSNELRSEQGLRLESGGSETVTFEDVDTSSLDAGDHNYSVFTEDSDVRGTLTITTNDDDDDSDDDQSGIDRFDQDGDSRFSFSEVLTAIGAHNSGTTIGGEAVSFNDVLAVIAEHNNPTRQSTQSDLARFDQNGDGQFSFSEVMRTIAAHNDGDTIGDTGVTFEDVLAVIAAHNDELQ